MAEQKPATSLPLKARRRVLEFAERVALLASEAPNDDAKKEVFAARMRLVKRYGFSQEEKRRLILHTIGLGAATHADLIRETGFDKDDVYRIVKELESEEAVECKLISLSGSGRRSLFVFPIP